MSLDIRSESDDLSEEESPPSNSECVSCLELCIECILIKYSHIHNCIVSVHIYVIPVS